MKRFSFVSTLRHYDWVVALVAVMLSSIGLAAIYSVDLSRGDSLTFFPTQFTALLIGLGLFLVLSSLHITFYERYARIVYGLSALLLIGVLFFGVTIRGTTGWFRFAGFSFQPAELAKGALILMLGWLIARYRKRFDRWQFLVSSAGIMGILAGCILLQPDLGSALVLIGIWCGLVLLTGTRRRYMIGLALLALVGAALSWFVLLADYQKDRIQTFLSPQSDPLGTGYNVNQSLIAVGSGHIFGRGLGFGSQSQLHFLPEAQTDFIFPVIAEELGFVGSSIVLILFFYLFWRLVRIAYFSQNEFGTYVILGIILVLVIQLVLNLGGALGMLPLTGVTLPFISYGGTSLILNFALLGIAESIARSTAIESQRMAVGSTDLFFS